MKKAFSLVELLVVIGIIGVLAGVLLGVTGGGSESARNAKCLANMRSLASACHTYGMSSGHYPLAGSIEVSSISASGNSVQMKYNDRPGWLSWNSRGAYPSQSTQASGDWYISAYNEDIDTREQCYTNGVLWKHISGNRSAFQCPVHVNKNKKHPPAWSYVMNSYFGWSLDETPKSRSSTYWGIDFEGLKNADRRLLFAELQFSDVGSLTGDKDAGSGIANDCTLQYGKNEYIGFNHTSGKKDRFAHICFADGHVDRIKMPKDGISSTEAQELTKLLCEGKDVTYTGSKYQELK